MGHAFDGLVSADKASTMSALLQHGITHAGTLSHMHTSCEVACWSIVPIYCPLGVHYKGYLHLDPAPPAPA